jgi:hypothetical protein
MEQQTTTQSTAGLNEFGSNRADAQRIADPCGRGAAAGRGRRCAHGAGANGSFLCHSGQQFSVRQSAGSLRYPLTATLVEGERRCETLKTFEYQNRVDNPGDTRARYSVGD